MPTFEGTLCPPPKGYIAIVVARFNRSITSRLLDGALAKLKKHKVHDEDIKVVWVPGAYELPLIANYFARDVNCLAIICLGCVIKGETSHDEHINRAVSMSLNDASAKFGTPIIFGVLTCNTVEQAIARSGGKEQSRDKTVDPTAGNKGAEAAEAALEMIDLMTELPRIETPPLPPLISKMFDQDDEEDDDYFDDDDDEFFDAADFPPRRKTVKKVSKKATKKSTKKSTKKKK